MHNYTFPSIALKYLIIADRNRLMKKVSNLK